MNNEYQRIYDVAVAMHDTITRDDMIRKHDTDIIVECAVCDDIKPIYQFYKQPSRKNGLKGTCIACLKGKYIKNKQLYKERYYDYKTKLQDAIQSTELKMIKIQKRQNKIVQNYKENRKI